MVIVRSGRWRYADAVDKPVDVVGLPYDFWFELAAADGQLEPGESPAPHVFQEECSVCSIGSVYRVPEVA